MLLLLAASLLAGVAAAAGVTRQHFLAAELIEWNYLPLGVNGMDGTREGDLWQEAVPGQRIGPARMQARTCGVHGRQLHDAEAAARGGAPSSRPRGTVEPSRHRRSAVEAPS